MQKYDKKTFSCCYFVSFMMQFEIFDSGLIFAKMIKAL